MIDCSLLLGGLLLIEDSCRVKLFADAQSPCSVHDPAQAIEYAKKLKAYAQDAEDDLMIIMRVYFEK